MVLHTQARTQGKNTKYIESKRDTRQLDRARGMKAYCKALPQPYSPALRARVPAAGLGSGSWKPHSSLDPAQNPRLWLAAA